jgi:hypothetical protein
MVNGVNFPWASGQRGRSGRGRRRRLTLLAPLFVVAACTTSPQPVGDPIDGPTITPAVVATAAEFRLETEPVVGARFPVLTSGVSVDVRHFDATLPVHKFRHSIRLVTEDGTAVLIDVWDNPQRLALRPWFDATLGFLVGESTKQSERPMSSAHVPGILLEEPASPQAGSQAIAVFASGTQVIRITCLNPDGNPVAKRSFDSVVDQIELGVKQ